MTNPSLEFPSFPRASVVVGVYTTMSAMVAALKSAGIESILWEHFLICGAEFSIVPQAYKVQLVYPSSLGRAGTIFLSDVYKSAKAYGFALCPAELAFYLRLYWRTQPVATRVYIGMEPIRMVGSPKIICLLSGIGNKQAIGFVSARDTDKFSLKTACFAFVKSTK